MHNGGPAGWSEKDPQTVAGRGYGTGVPHPHGGVRHLRHRYRDHRRPCADRLPVCPHRHAVHCPELRPSGAQVPVSRLRLYLCPEGVSPLCRLYGGLDLPARLHVHADDQHAAGQDLSGSPLPERRALDLYLRSGGGDDRPQPARHQAGGQLQQPDRGDAVQHHRHLHRPDRLGRSQR